VLITPALTKIILRKNPCREKERAKNSEKSKLTDCTSLERGYLQD
jgi:hypothetical protein